MASYIGRTIFRTFLFNRLPRIIALQRVLLLLFYICLTLRVTSSQRLPLGGGECTYTIQDASGEITSPGFPEPYPNSAQCSWTIIMPHYEKILLTFLTFKVRKGSSSTLCDRDYVEVLDGVEGNKILGKFCNSAKRYPSGTIVSNGNAIRVVFHSDPASLQGFPGSFLAVFRKQPCGDFLTGIKGEIRSPNYPNPYPAGKECIWRIQVPDNMVVKLYFLVFALEPTSECNLDFIKMRDGFNGTSRPMGHFCADRKPKSEVQSTGNKLLVEFKSFKPTISTGFLAFYEAVPHCGGILRGSMGSFSSPDLSYLKGEAQECTWKIQAENGEIVSVIFNEFDVGTLEDSNCEENYVEFYDGIDENSKVITRYCNSKKVIRDVRSTGKFMFVKLHWKATNDGFLATYTTVDPSNHLDKCSESANELLFKCDNDNYIQCQWKCDGTDDCGDHSDEDNCVGHVIASKTSKLRNYVIILISITASAVAIVVVAFIVDRLRKKRRARARVRRRRRRRRMENIDRVLLGNNGSPASPPPPYQVSGSACSTESPPLHPPPYSHHEASESPPEALTTLQELAAGQLQNAIEPMGADANRLDDMGATDVIVISDSVGEAAVTVDDDADTVSLTPSTSDTTPLIT